MSFWPAVIFSETVILPCFFFFSFLGMVLGTYFLIKEFPLILPHDDIYSHKTPDEEILGEGGQRKELG